MENFKKVAIVHHTYTQTSLVEEELRNFLLGKVEKLIYITHPFKQARDNLPLNSIIETYGQDGKLRERKELLAGIGPEIFFYLKDFFLTLFLLLKEAGQIDLYFGVDNLNAFTGVILRKIGKVKKVVYYVIDYVPKRFKNPLLNSIYHWLDFYCVKNVDQTWNLSEEMAKTRLKDELPEKYLAKQMTVPVGCHPQKIKKIEFSLEGEKRMTFLGILSQEQGIELLIESLPLVIKKISKVKLVVIGSGPLLPTLKDKIKKLKIENFVEFKGFVKDNREVDKILASCHLGLAPYILGKTSFKHFTDPGKIKTYLGAGLPIVMTNISHTARIIQKRKAGIVVNSSKREMVEAMIKLLTNKKLHAQFRRNAIALAQEYDWNKIFSKAFRSLT